MILRCICVVDEYYQQPGHFLLHASVPPDDILTVPVPTPQPAATRYTAGPATAGAASAAAPSSEPVVEPGAPTEGGAIVDVFHAGAVLTPDEVRGFVSAMHHTDTMGDAVVFAQASHTDTWYAAVDEYLMGSNIACLRYSDCYPPPLSLTSYLYGLAWLAAG